MQQQLTKSFSMYALFRIFIPALLFLFMPKFAVADNCIHPLRTGSSQVLMHDYGCIITEVNDTYTAASGKQWTAEQNGGSGPDYQFTCSASGVCASSGVEIVSCPAGEAMAVYKPSDTIITCATICFSFPSTPTITSVTPNQEDAGQSSSVTIVGSDFSDELAPVTVKLIQDLSTIVATGVTVIDSNTITCTLAIPAGAIRGAWDVVITNTGTGETGTGTGEFTVNNEHAPSVSAFTKNVAEDTLLTFSATDFSDHFSDIDIWDSLTKIKITTLSNHGTLQLSGSDVLINQEILVADLDNLTFMPDSHWNGVTNFSWNGSDGMMYAETATTATITITTVQDAPTVSDFSKTGAEDGTVSFGSDFGSNFNDLDSDPLNKIQILSLPANGILKLSGTDVAVNDEVVAANLSNLTFVPNANWHGSTSFSWNGSDGIAYALTAANVNITITADANVPTANNISKSGSQGSTLTFSSSDFTDKFSDSEVGILIKVKFDSLPLHGALQLSELDVVLNQEVNVADLDNLAFVPDVGWFGDTTFTWNGDNGVEYSTNDGTVAITLTNAATIIGGTDPDDEGLLGAGEIVSIVCGVAGFLVTSAYVVYKCRRKAQHYNDIKTLATARSSASVNMIPIQTAETAAGGVVGGVAAENAAGLGDTFGDNQV